VVQAVESLLCQYKALNSNPSHTHTYTHKRLSDPCLSYATNPIAKLNLLFHVIASQNWLLPIMISHQAAPFLNSVG
jgi:hypothetical protein